MGGEAYGKGVEQKRNGSGGVEKAVGRSRVHSDVKKGRKVCDRAIVFENKGDETH